MAREIQFHETTCPACGKDFPGGVAFAGLCPECAALGITWAAKQALVAKQAANLTDSQEVMRLFYEAMELPAYQHLMDSRCRPEHDEPPVHLWRPGTGAANADNPFVRFAQKLEGAG